MGQTNAHRGSAVGLNGRDQREAPASTATFRVALPLRKNHVPLTRLGTVKPAAYKRSAFTNCPLAKLIDETNAEGGMPGLKWCSVAILKR